MNFTTRRQRGSLILVTMLISAIIALCLTSYIQMAITAVKLSTRASWENQALNMTEIGLEQAMAAINANSWPSPTWTASGSDTSATFSGFDVGQGTTGSVKVYVKDYASSNPVVVAAGIITPPAGGTIVKEVEISGIIQRSLFSKGLVGRNGVSFSGNNASVDSWNSRYDDTGAARTSPVAYSSTYKHDKGSIAAVNISATDTVQNADIWGTASVGGNSTSLVSVGSQGLVGPFGTPSGTKVAANISTNFTSNLPSITMPSPSATNMISSIGAAVTLPRTGDVAASDGKYYYSVGSISLSGNGDTMAISSGKTVVLMMTTGQGATAIGISGQGEVDVASGAHLDIYTAANISVAGGGIVNANSTSCDAVQIWGTNTSSTSPGQTISVGGNGSLACTCYAPNAAISAKGGGNSGALYGAFVGYSVTLTGNDAFHYDENLGNANNSGTFSPSKWRELVTAADRATYSGHFGI